MNNLKLARSLNTKNIAYYCGAFRDIDTGMIVSGFTGQYFNFDLSESFETYFDGNERAYRAI